MRVRTAAFVPFLVILASACSGGGGGTTAPPPSYNDVSGSYSGPMSGVDQGVAIIAEFTVTVGQNGPTLSGSYALTGELTDGVNTVAISGTGTLAGNIAAGTNPSVNITVHSGSVSEFLGDILRHLRHGQPAHDHHGASGRLCCELQFGRVVVSNDVHPEPLATSGAGRGKRDAPRDARRARWPLALFTHPAAIPASRFPRTKQARAHRASLRSPPRWGTLCEPCLHARSRLPRRRPRPAEPSARPSCNAGSISLPRCWRIECRCPLPNCDGMFPATAPAPTPRRSSECSSATRMSCAPSASRSRRSKAKAKMRRTPTACATTISISPSFK